MSWQFMHFDGFDIMCVMLVGTVDRFLSGTHLCRQLTQQLSNAACLTYNLSQEGAQHQEDKACHERQPASMVFESGNVFLDLLTAFSSS
jgi:hypothetical protein